MAGKNSIQVLRGTAAKRAASSENLLAGQPFFETDTGKFYVGNGGAIKSATPIVATPAAHTHTVANITDLTATATELNYCDGVTSSIQTQLNNKAPKNHASTNSDYGLGSTSNYGHVKISNGDVASVASANGLAAGMDHSHSNYALSGHTHDSLLCPKVLYKTTGSTKIGSGYKNAVTIFTDAEAAKYKTFMVTLALESYYCECTGTLLLGNYMDDKWGGRVQFNFVKTYYTSDSPIIGHAALFCTLNKTTGEFTAYSEDASSTTYATYSYKLSSSGGFTNQGYDMSADIPLKITSVVGLC